MTDTSINKAAERLESSTTAGQDLIAYVTERYPDALRVVRGGVVMAEYEARATERRNTVELIRAELDGARRHGGMIARADVAAILDETEVAP